MGRHSAYEPEPEPAGGVRVSDFVVSLIRTWVPMAVGSALAWAATRWDLPIADGWGAAAGAWAAAGASAGYYLLARTLERQGGPGRWAGLGRVVGRWMLGGVIRQPTYARP